MPFVPVANTAEFELVQELDGETIENTLYFRRGTAWTAAQLATAAAFLASWWETNMAPNLGAALNLVRIECTDLGSSTGPSLTFVTGMPIPGVIGSPTCALNVAPAIKFKTESRGRSFTGRNYISGFVENAVNSSRLDAPTSENVTAAYQLLVEDGLDIGLTWVVVSRYSGIDPTTKKPIPRVAGVATPITTATFTDNVVDSQRRRLPNR
jgi:hypothetical protein